MALYNDTWMEMLLSKSDIASIISSYVSLRAKGSRLWGLCPFHNEKTPSFTVSPDKQAYYCFGCGAGGGIIQFVMDIEHLPYTEAVQLLAQRAGMELPQEIDDTELQKERAKKERLYAVCKVAAEYFHEKLISDEGLAARKYLAKRGLKAQVIKKFGLGFAPNIRNALLNHIKASGFNEDDLLEAGLLAKSTRTQEVYDPYRNRVIFPIIGANSRVLAFGGRSIDNEAPKYINTSETPIYSKRQNLYAINLLKGIKAPEVIIVEGYMDVISLYSAGITNAVASLGTALTPYQVRLLKRYSNSVYIAYDGDTAGQNATLKGLDVFAREGLNVRVVLLPDDSDPDDFIKKQGVDAFRALVDEALSLNAFKLERMACSYDLKSEEGRQEYAIEGCRFIASLQPVEQERYILSLARSTGISVEALSAQSKLSEAAEPKARHYRKHSVARPDHELALEARQRAELQLLRTFIQTPNTMDLVVSCTIEDLFTTEAYRDFALGLQKAYMQNLKPDLVMLMSELTSEQAKLITEVLYEDVLISNPQQFARDCLMRISLADLEAQILSLRKQAGSDLIGLEEKLELTQHIMKLDNERRQLRLE